ncbi:Methyltransferase domain-containing protein [Clostridium cavendishii DSM 21758]|uniref:Methyltransferase domain-containing protein n=1 Tax=Clostridium cavendishii DSM 21758 TaxID=1121302 RepID=A0A1M6I5E4_9CLOT|nr:class I SAM-dependent methyltransferase [Clostridium cavendishii]SHJ29652.1 Methyltransferase domain-containing protein [Clostridium cavendishii DSM 21758]
MKFYDELSKYYKYIFPMSEVTLNFLKDNIDKNKKVLDIACGSGEYTIGLSKYGYNVKGIDLDDLMIEKAKEKAIEEGVNVEFKVGNILKLDEVFNESFGGMFCIGNSLVHLDNIEEIEKALQLMKDKLEDKGILIIQIINYARILKFDLKSLQTIKNEEIGIEFIRNYKKKDDKIIFNTILKINDEESLENDVELLPITHIELRPSLEKVGFKNIQFFGGFNKGKFEEDESIQLIIKCEK